MENRTQQKGKASSQPCHCLRARSPSLAHFNSPDELSTETNRELNQLRANSALNGVPPGFFSPYEIDFLKAVSKAAYRLDDKRYAFWQSLVRRAKAYREITQPMIKAAPQECDGHNNNWGVRKNAPQPPQPPQPQSQPSAADREGLRPPVPAQGRNPIPGSVSD